MSERMWMVRAGEGARLFDHFMSKNIVAVGWCSLDSDIANIKTRDEMARRMKQAYPELRKHQLSSQTGQIYRFAAEFGIGDYVLSYDSKERKYPVGKITSDYQYKKGICEDYAHYRQVEWLGTINRDDISTSTRNSLGAISTIFEIKDSAKDEVLRLLRGEKPIIEEPSETAAEEDLETIREDIVDKSKEFIKDKIMALDWEEMQELVAGILRAMGFKTRVSDPGPDRGKDITASPDGLGLEDPKILVEVKHRAGTMGRDKVSSFIGGLRSGSKGLYVSTGGFSKDAHYEAERANIPVTLIDADELVRLIIQYYDQFDNDARALIPLTKLYWPAWE